MKNEENELMPTCIQTGWRVCIDYRKLNAVESNVKIMLTHKLNPICDNCSIYASRDRSNRGLTRDANQCEIDSKT